MLQLNCWTKTMEIVCNSNSNRPTIEYSQKKEKHAQILNSLDIFKCIIMYSCWCSDLLLIDILFPCCAQNRQNFNTLRGAMCQHVFESTVGSAGACRIPFSFHWRSCWTEKTIEHMATEVRHLMMMVSWDFLTQYALLWRRRAKNLQAFYLRRTIEEEANLA